jgi:hypothetical protein
MTQLRQQVLWPRPGRVFDDGDRCQHRSSQDTRVTAHRATHRPSRQPSSRPAAAFGGVRGATTRDSAAASDQPGRHTEGCRRHLEPHDPNPN